MPPLNLQGLNLVHSASATPHNDDSLASPPFPDFSAHLDLWTNLAFETDEPIAHNKGKRKAVDDSEEDAGSPLGLPTHDSHENVVHPPSTTIIPHSDAHAQQFDLNALLAGFGIDPFSLPQSVPAPAENVPAAPSLAQLLALHTAQGGTYAVPPPPPVVHAQPASQSANKRARTSKNSTPTEAFDPSSPSSPTAEDTPGDSTNPLSAAEDKRRRNTAASARFRLKKKEREAALERRAKELEERVTELERECEGLRRENGWLKGLVVGVTGAGAK
ncbi:hypothetical protein DEU56DRAFT_763146 [Suillus clintonianus]|uniref:uncharacterized protein n=1 Tax=Suillus clintonianus TaxID=1904413 RepID=UPI001B880659|nr:uncharacterized protein DEU56DRAFT_763146 [Suillus clintonianus]KAG2157112.1 hypothetical protein DEU56DRAFT_763146 [Suillus clintonianus]